MARSIRRRLQLWYALVLAGVIGGFGSALYLQYRADLMKQIDGGLEAGARFLEASVRGMPPPETGGPFPPPRGPAGEFERFERGPAARGPGNGPSDRRPEERGPDDRRSEDRRPEDRRPLDRPFRPPLDRPPPRPFGGLPQSIDMPDSLFNAAGPLRERPYYVIWRDDGSLLRSSGLQEDQPLSPAELRREMHVDLDWPLALRWQPGERREVVLAGPRRTLILVGRPVGPELGRLRTFRWQLIGSGALVLGLGLLGGWFISRSITGPIAAISKTAQSVSATNLSRRIETAGIDSELLGLAETLNATFDRLEAAFERQSRFTSDASHELRTPLAVIRSHAELALSKPRSESEYKAALSTCLTAAIRISELVEGLLVLARADEGQLERRLRAVDVRALGREILQQFVPEAGDAQARLSLDAPSPVWALAEPLLLARVLSNLLANAIRHSPPHGTVELAVYQEQQQAVLTVHDGGHGIPLDAQPRVFERFFRADAARSRRQGGTGLGLAISKSLVEALGGEISFVSSEIAGTTFCVRLQLAPEMPAVALETAEERRALR